MRYGIPYKGSKNAIAKWVVENLPPCDVLVDLFCGGCAVTHAALESGKFRRIIANDVKGDMPKLFLDAINGKYANERRWISRDEFFAKKDLDAYVRVCWAFGNDGDTYLYAREIEPFKKRIHELIFAETIQDRMSAWRAFVREFDRLKADIDRLSREVFELCEKCGVQQVTRPDGTIDAGQTKKYIMCVLTKDIREYMRAALHDSGKRISDVDRLLGTNGTASRYFATSQWALPTEEAYLKMQTMIPGLVIPWGQMHESLQSLQSLEIKGEDYRDVDIPKDAVVYCDIPYDCTSECYGMKFDRSAFSDWADAQTAPVIISEYNITIRALKCWQNSRKYSRCKARSTRKK